MAEIIIKKRVDLDFLGKDYEDSYLDFRSISVQEYPKLMKKVEATGDDNSESFKVIMDILKEQFVDGIFNKQKVDKEDMGKFDAETVLKCFEALTGQVAQDGVTSIDPKEGEQ